MNFPQLRLRSEFSFRSAYGSVTQVAEAARAAGAEYAGLVDTAGTWGHVGWEKAAVAAGLEPLFGAEFSIVCADERRRTYWALARDLPAFYQFSSTPPTTEREIAERKAGLIIFAGAALTDPAAIDYIDINPRSRLRTEHALALAARTGRPLVITSDADYPTSADRDRFLAWDDSLKMTPQHILTRDELRAALWYVPDETFEEACENTERAAREAAGCRARRAPIISVPGNLKALAEAGKADRLARGQIKKWTDVYEQRLQRELAMIKSKKYESYFLVVADMIAWAKKHMLVGPGRGSSAGSLVCYLLHITEIDPLVHDLIFERFIDVTRSDLPDIDSDFNDSKRDDVFKYLADKYGRENTARIGSVNRLKPRSVLAHVGKKLGIPIGATFPVVNVLIEYSSGDSRYGKGLEDTLANTAPGRDFLARYPEASLMTELEEHASHTGVHAAGFIVSNEPVTEYCTVRDGVAQIDKKDAETLGLLKMDILGLRTLGVIEDAACVTAQELYDLKLDDPEVFRIFNERKFSGLFQFEGAAQRRVSIQIPVKEFRQIDHITALARPGPLGGGAANTYINRNAGREPVEYRHPSMAAYLADTQGVVLYQEQVMRIAFEIGKLPWEVVSEIRKAMSGRKGKEYFDRRGDEFVRGAVGQGIPEADARTIWSEIVTFGAWGMNKSICAGTKVKLAHPNQFLGRDPTIKQVYEFYKCSQSPWIRQRHIMPKMLALDSSGIAKPVEAIDLTFNGIKHCIKLIFVDGREIECSRDHKFIINGQWQRCGDAAPGDEFESCAREHWIKDHSFTPGIGRGWRKGRTGGAGDSINSRGPYQRAFRTKMKGMPCQGCGKTKSRMIVHHNDNCHGKLRPNDLAWLCDRCHKQLHIDNGDWLPPYSRGWRSAAPAILASIEDIGEQETYDIHMPEPDHNYLLANGIVTHNSHTVSYAVVSYWCAYMKRYHQLEYAAALLRNAKDEEQTIEMLRELIAEGVRYVPFDPDRSGIDWAVVDGDLVGGFKNLVGVGPIKAAKYAASRPLSAADRAALAKCKIKFSDLSPAHTLWGAIYRDPDAFNILGPVKEFAELEDMEEAVVVCQLIRQERRDENETVRAHRRGYMKTGQTLFLDAFVVDDSISKPIILRIKPWQWDTIGRKMADRAVPKHDWFLVRGKWLAQFSMFTVIRIKCLTNPEVFA